MGGIPAKAGIHNRQPSDSPDLPPSTRSTRHRRGNPLWLPATVNPCRYPFRHFLSALILLPLLASFTAEATAQTPVVTIAKNSNTVTEGTGAAFTITATPAPAANLVVSLRVTVGTNEAFVAPENLGSDKTVTILADQSSAIYTVPTINDNTDESTGQLTVRVETGSGYTVDNSQISATIGIFDNDNPAVSFDASTYRVTEGHSVSVTLNLVRPQSTNTVVTLTCTGTATSGSDYTCPAATSIPANTGSHTVTLQTTEDTLQELAETLTLTISSITPNGIDIGGPSSTTITIDDNDQPVLTLSHGTMPVNPRHGDPAHRLEESADTLAVFIVTATPPFTVARDARIRIESAQDHTPNTGAHTLSFTASGDGAGEQRFTAPVRSDITDRLDGEIRATLLPSENNTYTLGNSTIHYDIVDNDPTKVTLSVTDSTADEDDATDTAKINLLLSRGLVSGERLDIPLQFSGGALGDDFTLAKMDNPNPAGVTVSGSTVTFTGPSTGATAMSVTLIVTAAQDTDTEDETVTVSIPAQAGTNPNDIRLRTTGFHCRTTNCKATGAGSGMFTLSDNDTAVLPEVTFHTALQNYTEKGGTTSARTHNARVNFSPALPANITLNYAVSGNATSNTDYTALSGTIAVSAGANQVNIPIIVTDDTTDEFIENVTLTLNNGSGYTVGSARTYRLTLIDNDPTAVTLSVPGDTATEGDSTATARITLRLGRAMSVDLATESLAIPLTFTGGILNTDFSLALSGTPTGVTLSGSTVTFTGPDASEIAATLILTALADADTDNETVTVSLGALTPTGLNGGANGSRTGNGQITLTDAGTQTLPEITIAAGTSPVIEGTAATFTVTAMPPPQSALTVNLTITDAPNSDFVSASNQQGTKTVTIQPASTTSSSATYSVPTETDTTDEPNGPVMVTIASGSGYTIGSSGSASVTVNDDDAAPQNPGTVNPPPTNPTPTNPVNPPTQPDPSPTPPGETPTEPQQPEPEPEPEPVIPVLSIQASSDAVTEGAVASFTITADPAPVEPITVPLIIAASGDFTAPQSTGAKTLTIDRSTTSLMIPTLSDFLDEANGSVTVTLQAANGYSLGSHPSATVTIHDDDTAGITLSVSGLRIPEIGQSAQYTLQLTSQPAAAVTVTRIPSESTIVTFSPSSVTFTQDNWNTPQSFTLTAQQEGTITLVHAMTSTDPNYAGIQSARGRLRVVVGEDWSAVAASWQSRLARTSAGHVLDGIAERIQSTPTAGLSARLAGYRMDTGTPKEMQSRWMQNSHSVAEPHSRAVTVSELLPASSMSWTGTGTDGSIASFWAQGAVSELDGKSGETTLDGEVLTTLIGVDQTHTTGQRGLVLSHSQGEGNYQSRNRGEIESEQTLFTPWWSQDFNDHLTIWGALGYGTGEVTIKRNQREDLTTDTDTAFIALGSDALFQEEDHRTLSVVTDALWLRTRSDEVAGGLELQDASAHVSKMRVGVQSDWRTSAINGLRFAAGQTLKTRLSSALRHDGGDAESGFGIEVGGGVQWIDQGRGLNLQIQGRSLITHHDSDIKDRGLSISMGFEPSPIKRGLEWTLQQDWGTVSSGRERLLNADAIVENASSASQRLSAEAGYRFTVGDGRYTARPWLGVGLNSEDRETRLGWRLQSTIGRSERTLGLKLTRHDHTGQPSEHHIQVEAGVRW